MIYLLVLYACSASAQNLVVDGTISNNANWNGQEAPYNSGTGENAYISGGCGSNYVMEVDNQSMPQQVVNGFVSGMTYKLSFRYAWRTASCSSSVDPSILNVQFTDATSVLNINLSVPSSQSTFTNVSFSFTNNAAITHTLLLTNPGNANTCGVILDDIAITPDTSPGGIGTAGLSFWMNASYLGMADNSGVYGWISGGSNVVSLIPNCSSAPLYHTGQVSAASGLVANYNPYVTFNGSNQYLQYSVNRISSASIAAGGTVAAVFSAFEGGSANQTFFGNKASSNSILTGRTGDFTMNDNGAIGTSNVISYASSSRVNLVSLTGKSNGVTLGDCNGTAAPASNGTSDSDYLTVGANLSSGGAYSQYFGGSFSELVIYNKSLTNTQAQQVRSYLAAKYGVTLSDNTISAGLDEQNYLASDGTTNYWTYATNATYHNNVSVIGRDDNSSWNQPKSISTDADANSHTGNAMLIISNGGTYSADKAFFATGHNGISASLNNTADIPAGIQTRMQRVWKFQKTGSGIPGSITVQFDMTGSTPLTGSDLRLLVSTTASFSVSMVIAGSYVAPYFTATLPTTGGVYYTLGSINNVQTPLPIELLSFSAAPVNKTVQLNWATAAEVNNAFFTVERSSDGSSFYPLLNVMTKAPDGNSTTPLHYEVYDSDPLRNISYYRLKQTDLSGHTRCHHIVMVDLFESNTAFAIYPNPNKGEFFMDLSHIRSAGEIRIAIFDAAGKEHYAHSFYKEKDGEVIKLSLLSELASGTYFCTLVTEGYKKTISLVVE